MEEIDLDDIKEEPEKQVDAVNCLQTSSLLPSAPRKSKTPAERQRELRLRRKLKILNEVEQEYRRETLRRKNENQKRLRDIKRIINKNKKRIINDNKKRIINKNKNKNIDKPAKKSRAAYQREYRLRKKNINVDLNSDLAEVIPRQEAGSSWYLAPSTTAQSTQLSPDAGPIIIPTMKRKKSALERLEKRLKLTERECIRNEDGIIVDEESISGNDSNHLYFGSSGSTDGENLSKQMTMPRRCCVPGCKSNYGRWLKNEAAVTVFTLPKNVVSKMAWLRAIPGENWSPTPSSAVCVKHFNQTDIITTQRCKDANGDIQNIPLRQPKVTSGAVPSIFQIEPSYLSTSHTKTRDEPASWKVDGTHERDFKQVNIQDDLYNQAAQSLSSRTPTASSASQLIKLDEETSDGDSNDHTSTSGAGDKYDAFGRYVAAEVRQLDEDQRTIVERIIYEAIHAGKIGSLNGNSKLVVNSETSLIEPSDDDNMCSEDGEVNSQVDAVETKFDIDEPEYVLGESFNEAREVSCLYGVGRKVNAEILITSNVPVEMPQLQVDENICIKVENETEENDNSEKPELSQPFEELLVKQEIKTEDDDPHEDLKTEFVINKQQSSINVYRSTDAKRQRMDCTEEAKIHLELQDSNVKR